MPLVQPQSSIAASTDRSRAMIWTGTSGRDVSPATNGIGWWSPTTIISMLFVCLAT
jgi:hypothetical protein